MSIEFRLYKMKRVMEMGCSDGFMALQMYLIPRNCILKMVNTVNFILYVLYHIKNILEIYTRMVREALCIIVPKQTMTQIPINCKENR